MTHSYGNFHRIDESAADALAPDKFQQAVDACRKQLQANENDFLAWLKLGDALQAQRWNAARFPVSLACYRKSLELHADNPAAYHKIGNVLKRLGKQEAAKEALNKALALDPGLVRARFSLLNVQCPILYEKEAEILSSRTAYARVLDELRETIDLDDPDAINRAADAVGEYPFHLGYQGYNDCSLQRAYGNLVCRIQAARYPQWSQPLPPPPQKDGEPLRVGVVSGFFCDHATWNFPVSGWLKALNRERFALYGYHTGTIDDHNTDVARQSFDRFVEHDFSLASLCNKILADRLHVLFYPEIGMNGLTVRLSSLRLAPVQCVSWGHSTTSGLPTMDYFLSSDLMEPADAADHYTETLVRLPNLGVHYPPPEIETGGVRRAELGLKEDAVLYLCLQSLFKYLPQYDEVFPRIAQKTGNCQFVFGTGRLSRPVINILHRRLDDAFSRCGLKSENYIVFFPYLEDKQYLSLYRSGDVFLDSIGWSGCNTTMNAAACSLPVVTLPGDLMRGRQSMAILKRMGLTDTIADSMDDYVQIAVRLGTDAHWRKHVGDQTAANKHKLYADNTCIEALEIFLEKAAEDSWNQWDVRKK